ncbi:hypothetical protein GCM10027275_36880 [Rhabdobacter roseus]|uniref:Peroxiredoxin n=1 Tax=Rhabdobacter roseus TaxID=1655419 RepID=A0A840TSP3_9BACT|nr:TlpA disulfide reductase family protein [Rhabdobacter roseus]MBB5285905.1 peroxiredoxin [Rhabdobacter roseus]
MKTKKFRISSILMLLLGVAFNAVSQPVSTLREGPWRGVFLLNDTEVPFNFEIKKESHASLRFTTLNAGIRDEFWASLPSPDSLFIPLGTFEAALVAKIQADGTLRGSYQTLGDGRKRVIPFTAQPGKTHRFEFSGPESTPASNLSGRWVITLKNTENAADRVAVLEQKGSRLTGAILSITGDSRALEGNVQGNSFFLSGFTGASPYYLRGTILDDNSLSGSIGTGPNATPFEGTKNDQAALPDAYSLTYLKPGYDRLDFSLPNLDGQLVSLRDEKYRGKVVVIEIMGTWCPNCMDQVTFLAPWYKQNKDRGVEVIGVAFEAKDDLEYARYTLSKLKKRYDVQYDLLFGGKADKQVAAEKFPALDHVLAFPTTVIIGRDGKVRQIHTGYSGEATGNFYTAFVKHWNEQLDTYLTEVSTTSSK